MEYEAKIKFLEEKVKAQSKVIEKLQDNLNDEKIVLEHLTSKDERQENLKTL